MNDPSLGTWSYTCRRRISTTTQQTLAWSTLNELSSVATVTSGVSGRIESYLYDDQGERIYRQSVLGSDLEWRYYTFWPHFEIGTADDGASWPKRYWYFFGGQRIAQRDATGLHFLHTDALGSTRVVSSGAASDGTRSYYAFGVTRTGSLPARVTHGFTGQEEDSGTGLVYMHARYYDPQIGQFVSPDTIVPDPTQLLDYNRYRYARANPLQLNDPSGHCNVLDDGSPDMGGDANFACWQAAFTIYGFAGSDATSFADDWKIAADQWLTTIASASFADQEYLQPFVDKYTAQWAGSVGLTPVKWNEAPPAPAWVEEARMAHYTSLYQCAKAIGGACGIGLGGMVVAPGVAARGSFDFFVDYNGDFGGFGTLGAGPAITIFPEILSGPSYSASYVPHASIKDISGWSVQIGGSAATVSGLGADLNVAISETAPRGVVASTPAGTFNAEMHATISYTWEVFSNRGLR